MINAVRISFPGWRGPYGLAGVVDAVCKINGPRGLGSAATYNESSNTWGIANRAMHLAADGLTPNSSDIGRIWNEGLAFYGWLFYLSKFYEVLDTIIILAKGKKSSFLQTYHHAGAMMCMWAGIRYMAPPIWMFVLVNSGLHALMVSFYLQSNSLLTLTEWKYTYYTLTALGVKVPRGLKRTLTTLQIVQFVVGASFAFAHLFIAYTIPVSTPYTFSLADLTSVASAVTTDAASAVSVATATASAGFASILKKLAFRAAGREGLAENVVNDAGERFGFDAFNAVEDLKAREEIRYRDEMQWIHCTDTSGQVFAILLNCMYLAPLTWLFVRFFIRSYTQRLERRRSSTTYKIEQSAKDAYKGVARQTMDAIGEMHGSDDAVDTEGAIDSAKETLSDGAKAIQKLFTEGVDSAKKVLQEAAESSKKNAKVTQESASGGAEPSEEKTGSSEEPMSEGGDLVDTKTELNKDEPMAE